MLSFPSVTKTNSGFKAQRKTRNSSGKILVLHSKPNNNKVRKDHCLEPGVPKP